VASRRHSFRRLAPAVALVATFGVADAPAAQGSTSTPAPTPPIQDYLVYVAAESADRLSLVRFGPSGIRVERDMPVGMNPMDPDGPHGLGLSPDGRSLFASTAHGTPYGHLWKYDAATGEQRGLVMLGSFPASLQVSPDGHYAYVVNFNLHGDMVPSAVSVVATGEMVEVARIETCTMPHGSRLTADGARHYSTCMMDDMLVEIDTRELAVSRHFVLSRGRERGMTGAPAARSAHAAGDHGAHGVQAPAAGAMECSPTWAVPTPDGSRVFVACNKSDEIVEVDGRSWTVTRRLPAGAGVYNLGMTHDARRLVATNKRGQSVSVFDVASGRELARLPTTRRVVHGVAISPDDRYAFISVEGVGAEPGTVEVVDLQALQVVATVDVGQQSGGIDFWRTVAPGR
jgi:DNA-binding beta-propeller fold protein YncE